MEPFVLVLAVALLGSLAEAPGAAQAPGPFRPQDRDAIRAHIEEIFHAYMRRDRATVRATHAPEWRGFIRPSRKIVRGIEAYMRDAEPILASPGTMKSYEMVEFDVLFYGDLAIVPYIARIEWVQEGVVFPDTLRVLDVYAKIDGHWNQVASQVATHPDALAAQRQQLQTLLPSDRSALLADREAVWRAWFSGDEGRLRDTVPPDSIALNAGEEAWQDQEGILESSRTFAQSGARLVRLEFPRTEIRAYGDVAVLYTTYLFEVESGGEHHIQSGRGTEIFVRRSGRWVNPGWHLDSGR